jgi:hypothetical protein
MTIPGPSPASMGAGSCASERISTGVSPAVTQIGPRCTSPDLSFVSLILLARIGIVPHHFIEVMVATLRLVWQGACGTAHARQRPIPSSKNACSAMSKPIVVACSRTPPSVAVRHRHIGTQTPSGAPPHHPNETPTTTEWTRRRDAPHRCA